jgi:hypothetical protein
MMECSRPSLYCDVILPFVQTLSDNKKKKIDRWIEGNEYCDQRVESWERLLSHLVLSSYHEAKGYNRSANAIKVRLNKVKGLARFAEFSMKTLKVHEDLMEVATF